MSALLFDLRFVALVVLRRYIDLRVAHISMLCKGIEPTLWALLLYMQIHS